MFCCLFLLFAVWSDLDPNCHRHSDSVPERIFEKVNFKKYQQSTTFMKKYQGNDITTLACMGNFHRDPFT